MLVKLHVLSHHNILLPSIAELTHWATITLISCQKDPVLEIHVVIVDEHKMRSINWQYRKLDQATDVLSFPQDHYYTDWDSTQLCLGEIWCCPVLIHKSGLTWKLLYVHSILHLLGYDHVNDTSRAIMEKQEDYILARIAKSQV